MSSRSNSMACTSSIIRSCSRASLSISPLTARSSSSLTRSKEAPGITKSVSIASLSGDGSGLRVDSRPRRRPPRRPRPRGPAGSSTGVSGRTTADSASASRSGSARSWLASIWRSRSMRDCSICSAAICCAVAASPFLAVSTTIRSNSASSSKKSETYRKASRSRPMSTNADCIPGSTRITRPL